MNNFAQRTASTTLKCIHKGSCLTLLCLIFINMAHSQQAINEVVRQFGYGRFNDIQFSHDGERFASASIDGQVRIWSIESGRVTKTLNNYTNLRPPIRFSHDDKYLCTSSLDYSLLLWDTNSGSLIRRFYGHQNYIKKIDFSGADNRIVTLSADNTARVWDINSGQELIKIETEEVNISSAAISTDGNQLLTGLNNGHIKLHNIETGEVIISFQGHNESINDLDISNNDAYALSGSIDGSIRIWNLLNGQQIQQYNLDSNPSTIEFKNNNHIFIFAARAGKAWVLNRANNSIIYNLSTTPFNSHCDYNAITGNMLEGIDSKIIQLRNINNNEIIKEFPGHNHEVIHTKLSPDQQTVVTIERQFSQGNLAYLAKIWDANTAEQINQFNIHNNAPYIYDTEISPDNKYLLTAASDNSAILWNIPGGSIETLLLGHHDDVRDCNFSSDNKFVITSSDDNTVRVWNKQRGSETETYTLPERVRSAIFLDNNTRIAAGLFDGRIFLINRYNGVYEQILTPSHNNWHTGSFPQRYVTEIFTNELTNQIIALNGAGYLTTWNYKTGDEIRFFSIDENLSSIDVLPNFRFAVVGGGEFLSPTNFFTWVLDLNVGNIVKVFEGHGAMINSVDFSSDGNQILTGSNDGTAKLWNIDPTTGLRKWIVH